MSGRVSWSFKRSCHPEEALVQAGGLALCAVGVVVADLAAALAGEPVDFSTLPDCAQESILHLSS